MFQLSRLTNEAPAFPAWALTWEEGARSKTLLDVSQSKPRLLCVSDFNSQKRLSSLTEGESHLHISFHLNLTLCLLHNTRAGSFSFPPLFLSHFERLLFLESFSNLEMLPNKRCQVMWRTNDAHSHFPWCLLLKHLLKRKTCTSREVENECSFLCCKVNWT